MADPWFDPNWFGAIFGSVAGGLGGTLCGLLGSAAGAFAPRGKYRGPIVGGFVAFTVLGGVSLLVGLYAVVSGQPFGIWFPLTLVGCILVIVTGGLLPVLLRRYAEAEQRRVEAEGIRNA